MSLLYEGSASTGQMSLLYEGAASAFTNHLQKSSPCCREHLSELQTQSTTHTVLWDTSKMDKRQCSLINDQHPTFKENVAAQEAGELKRYHTQFIQQTMGLLPAEKEEHRNKTNILSYKHTAWNNQSTCVTQREITSQHVSGGGTMP